MKNRSAAKKILGALLTAALVLPVLSGCGKKGKTVEEPVKNETAQAEENTGETAASVSESANEPKEEQAKESEAFDPKKLEYKDRFLAGKKNVFFINDDDRTDQILRCTEEDELIEFAGGDGDHFYAVVNDGHMKHTLYYWNSKNEDGSFELSLPDDTGIYHMAAYNDRFYYDYYDGTNDEYPVWYFDPEKKETVRDQETERMKKFLDSYKGKSMAVIDYMSFIPGDLAKSGQMYRKNTEDNTVSVFDSKGDEIYSVSPAAEGGEWFIADDTYLLQSREEYGTSNRVSSLQSTVFNVKTGIFHPIWEGTSVSERFEPLFIKDGYFYYCIEEKYPDGTPKTKKFFREKKEELDNKDLNGQPVLEIPVLSGVIDPSVPGGAAAPWGFNVKGSRAYYLWFDDEKESKTRGDISWRAVDMNRTDFDDDTVVTGAKESHADFADLGYIETDKEAETEKDFRYFTSTRDRFYFYDEVENAKAMNEALQKIYDDMAGFAKDTKETAHNDVFGEESWYDLDDPDAWCPAYSYDVNLGTAQKIGSHHVEVSLDDYAYYGGAHGMPGIRHILFDTGTGKEVSMKDLFKGSEKEFRDIVVQYSMDDWKNSGDNKYYESYDPSLEKEMKQGFEDIASFDMIIRYDKDGIYAEYSPYAVGPFASGFIDVFVPYSALGIEEEMK